MDAKLLFAVLIGLLCCHGETNGNSLTYQRYRNVVDEPVDDAVADMYVRSLNMYNQFCGRFQMIWNKMRNDLNSWYADESQIQNTFPIQIEEIMYPKSVSKKVKRNILKRRRRNDNLPSTSSIAPFTQVTTNIQSTSVTSINVSQSENISPMSTIYLTSSVPKVQNYSSTLSNSTVVPVSQVATNISSTSATNIDVSESENTSPMSTMSSLSSVPKVQNYSSASNSTVVPPVQESPSYDSTSIKFIVPENESTISPLTPPIKINQGDLNNDHILQNNTNDVKIDKMVDENTKTSTSSDTKGPMFWYIICLFAVITVVLVFGVHRWYMDKTWFRSMRNRAHYDVRRGNCHEDEGATQV